MATTPLDARPGFLGRGWAFPPRFSPTGVAMTADEADVRQSLTILFSTRPGERALHPGYGLDLRPLLFEPLSTTARTLLEDRIRSALLQHEPRVEPLGIAVDDRDLPEGRLAIRIEVCLRSTNSRFNLVLPYALGGGDAHEGRTPP